MHYRNLMALDTEAMIRAQPLDAVVLIGGCDKTVPAQLMAAVSAGVPAVQLVVGPMSAMRFEGERLSACTDCRRFWAAYRAGGVDAAKIARVEEALATTAGTCGVMGTASTMAAIAAVLGFMPLEAASIPAVHADRLRAAEAAGRAGDAAGAPAGTAGGPAHPGQPGQRADHPACPRRLHQRRAASGRHRWASRARARSAAAGCAVRAHAGARGSQAHRRRLHGGLPRRRRGCARCCTSCATCSTLPPPISTARRWPSGSAPPSSITR